ncbi:hypothetical protein C8R43DRAFT_947730 [Mycena crocata]|nr:hypothetical protein C8R43DRAFT_947730 [Mycena crocata]
MGGKEDNDNGGGGWGLPAWPEVGVYIPPAYPGSRAAERAKGAVWECTASDNKSFTGDPEIWNGRGVQKWCKREIRASTRHTTAQPDSNKRSGDKSHGNPFRTTSSRDLQNFVWRKDIGEHEERSRRRAESENIDKYIRGPPRGQGCRNSRDTVKMYQVDSNRISAWIAPKTHRVGCPLPAVAYAGKCKSPAVCLAEAAAASWYPASIPTKVITLRRQSAAEFCKTFRKNISRLPV